MVNRRGALLLALMVAALLLTLVRGRAHDNPTDWIGQERRRNADGVLCCGEGDCRPIPMSAIKITPGGYVLPDGEVIPFNVPAPSADGLFWICEWGGSRKCTFAPIGGT